MSTVFCCACLGVTDHALKKILRRSAGWFGARHFQRVQWDAVPAGYADSGDAAIGVISSLSSSKLKNIGTTSVAASASTSSITTGYNNALLGDSLSLCTLATADVDIPLPDWFIGIASRPRSQLLRVREWEDDGWRTGAGGWSGSDFVHGGRASPVRVLSYCLYYTDSAESCASSEGGNDGSSITGGGNGAGGGGNRAEDHPSCEVGGRLALVGPAYFSPAAESHAGRAHGGAFCALMDDAIGWMGFCASGAPRPWSGFTVQVSEFRPQLRNSLIVRVNQLKLGVL